MSIYVLLKLISINDSYGHIFGDKYLQEIAKSLTAAIRPGDLVSRYGGHEFAMILPEGDLAYVQKVSNKIYHLAEQLSIQSPRRAYSISLI